jgi:hypothetical protein
VLQAKVLPSPAQADGAVQQTSPGLQQYCLSVFATVAQALGALQKNRDDPVHNGHTKSVALEVNKI